ncbi:MAG: 3-dehydroquinate synthase [Candidatus Omnitrophica bacterium]|nr:3-dehydroquinate synthase [Candidatus Omnitrophota bacterium]
MKKIRCKLGKRSYSIYVGRNIVSKLGRYIKECAISGKVLVVTNRKISRLYFSKLKRSLLKARLKIYSHILPDSERAKSQKELFKICNTLAEAQFDRYSTVVALGGGVIGDVSGFCASTYMRGINFVNVPTTLLAQVDSAVGGKTAINLVKGKNLVGTFHQPRCVISDISVLSSLSKKQLAISLAEVIKYGIIWDSTFFRYLENNIEKALKGNAGVLEHIVYTSSKIKVRVVEQDEKEISGLRAILNYGHTFAHAFEAEGKYTAIEHGEAVALGMIAAARLAQTLGVCSVKDVLCIESLIKRIGLYKSLRKYKIKVNNCVQLMQLDKKNRNNTITLVLPTKIGRVKIVRNVSSQLIKRAIKSLYF